MGVYPRMSSGEKAVMRAVKRHRRQRLPRSSPRVGDAAKARESVWPPPRTRNTTPCSRTTVIPAVSGAASMGGLCPPRVLAPGWPPVRASLPGSASSRDSPRAIHPPTCLRPARESYHFLEDSAPHRGPRIPEPPSSPDGGGHGLAHSGRAGLAKISGIRYSFLPCCRAGSGLFCDPVTVDIPPASPTIPPGATTWRLRRRRECFG